MRDPGLWIRLSTFTFDPMSRPGTFACRLAQAAGWTTEYAYEVMEEYRRMLYLCAISEDGAPLPVPPAIERAWRMHMADAQDYWERLCVEALEVALDLPPKPQSRDDRDTAYDGLRALYAREFGSEPSAAIWPDGLRASHLQRCARAAAAACCAAIVGIVALPVSGPSTVAFSAWLSIGLMGAILTSGVAEP